MIADEVIQIVRLMDGAYRFRFANDPELLAAWGSASNTFGPVRQAVGRSDGQAVDNPKPGDGTKGEDHAA